jgi:hypothetical protein
MDNAAYSTRMYSRLVEVATRYPQVSTHPEYAVVTRRLMDVSPYRTIGTALSKPRLEVTGPEFTSPGTRILTFLPWHRCVVTESKYRKEISVSLPPIKTTIVLIRALKRILTVGFRKYGCQCHIILIWLWYQLWHPTPKQGWSVLARIHTRCQHRSIDA